MSDFAAGVLGGFGLVLVGAVIFYIWLIVTWGGGSAP